MKSLSLPSLLRTTSALALSGAFAIIAAPHTFAADIVKANNNTGLNNTASWVGAVVPTSTDTAVWDSTFTIGTAMAELGGNVTFGGIRLTNPGQAITININSGRTFTFGPGSGSATTIDMTNATQDLTIGNVVGQGTFRINSSSQTWLVASGRTLTINSSVGAQGTTKSLTFGDATNTGSIVINSAVNPGANPLGFSVQGANVTLNGSNAWRVTTNSFNISSGTLNLGNDGALTTATAATSFGLNGGTITAAGGTRSISTSAEFSLGGNLAIADHSGGANALAFGSAVTLSGGDRTITNNATQNVTFGAIGLSNNATARTLTFSGTGTTIVSGTVSNNGTTLSNSVASAGSATSGNVVKNGSGILRFDAVNSYTGTTTVNAGTLLVNGSIASSASTIVAGGVLGGSGTTGILTVNTSGTLAPGNSIGTLTTGDLTLNGAATFEVELNTSTVTSDRVNSGAFNLDSNDTVILTLADIGSNAALANGTTFTIVDYTGSWDGDFFTYNSSVLLDDAQFIFGANEYQISYNGTSGLDSAVTLTVVPEPSVALCFGLGAASVLFFRRRRTLG